jgi:phosphotriesterase-related protein
MKWINLLFVGVIALLHACSTGHESESIETVKGSISPSELGMTLSHEHILVDFIGADSSGYHRWDRSEVVSVVLPYLLQIKKLGYSTLIECTPAYLGRDPGLLKILSDSSGLNILTNTGYYGARKEEHIPDFVHNISAEELADIWISEWVNGIEDTGIKPGFIKIGMDYDSLTPTHEKLVRAAAITHAETGLVIASHTGPAEIAFWELELLREEGVDAEAFIWVHAQRETDFEKYKEAAFLGAWVSLDGISERNIEAYVERLVFMKSHDLLGKVLISHDAGWYRPGEPGGGNFRPYTDINEFLLIALLNAGFSETEIKRILIDNPSRAFSIYVKKIK